MMIYRKQSVLYLFLLLSLAIFIGYSVSINPIESLIVTVTLLFTIIVIFFLLTKREQTLSLFSLILIPSLLLIPEFPIGEMDFRFEDFIVIFLTIGLMYTWLNIEDKTKILPRSILIPLTIYLVYSFLLTIIQMVIKETHPIYLLFFLKEIQYFIYFIVFCYLSSNISNFTDKAKKILLLVSIVTILWGIYQITFRNIIGYYGIGIISTPTASQSGIAFFLVTFILFYLSSTAHKKLTRLYISCLALLSTILTIGTVTRTSIVVLGIFLFMYVFFSLFRKKWNFIKIYFITSIGMIIIPISYLLSKDLFTFMLERFSRFRLGMEERINIWDRYLNNIDVFGLIFGNGKGYMQVIIGSFVLKADNQYVRLIVEIGYFGLILWIVLIGSIIIFSIKNFKNNYTDSMFLLILTISFLVIGLTQEGYMVTIQASLYWILTGFFVGKIINNSQRDQQFFRLKN